MLPEELDQALHHLNDGTDSGPDGITSELMKNGGEELFNALLSLMNRIIENKKLPMQFTTSVMNIF